MTGSGVYEILHVESGKRYIGSAKDFQKRWNAHRSHLRRGSHHSPHLQRSWVKHGESGFEFKVLEPCDPSHVILLEQVWLDWCKPEFNVCPKAYSTAGRKFTEATKLKISESRIGLKMPVRGDAHRAKISAALKGRKKPEHVMAALAAGRDAYTPTADNLKKRSESLKLAYASGLRQRAKSEEHSLKIGRTVAKLSDEQVKELKLLSADGMTGRALAVKFNVPTSTVSQIINGKTYRWVE